MEKSKTMVYNAQEWLNSTYKRNQWRNLIELKIEKKELNGILTITNWKELVLLDCTQNQLTKLQISDCPKLKYVYAWANQLTELRLSNIPKLEILRIESNQFTNLEFLSQISKPERLLDLRITNNKQLQLPNWELSSIINEIAQFTNLKKLGLCNMPFTGSLSPLGVFTKLEWLDIRGAQFSSGLEQLPVGLKEINCNTNCVKNTEPNTSYPGEKLENCQCWINKEHCCFGSQSYNYQKWRNISSEESLITTVQSIYLE